MKLKIGDLVVIRDESKFIEAVDSFHEKWTIAPTMASATVMAMGTAVETVMAMETATTATGVGVGEQTGKSIKLKYYGYKWNSFDQIIGVVTEVIQEDYSDLDVIKIREQSGGTRYCRRYIIERAQESS